MQVVVVVVVAAVIVVVAAAVCNPNYFSVLVIFEISILLLR